MRQHDQAALLFFDSKPLLDIINNGHATLGPTQKSMDHLDVFILSRAKARGLSPSDVHLGRRAAVAEGAYREYVTDEQRRRRPKIIGQSGA